MRYFFIIVALIFIGKIGNTQNLVSNGSFEQLTSCNNLGGGGIDSAIGWWDINTADAFNTCSVNSSSGVPSNSYGYQQAYEGNGYAFFATYFNPLGSDYREYIQTKLTDTLIVNDKYYVSFRISFADNFQFASDGIGAFFSLDSVFGIGPGNLVDSIPQVEVASGIPIIDSSSWTLVQGSFIANGNETFMTIGNFKNDVQTTTQDLGGIANSGGYFIDAVCVSVDSLTCYNFVGVKESTYNKSNLNLYPNPVSNELFFDTAIEFNSIVILDATGRIIKSINSNLYSVNVADLPKGFYFLQLYGDEKILTQKFVKN